MIIDSIIRDITEENQRTVNKMSFWYVLFTCPWMVLPAMFANQVRSYK